MLRLKLPAVLAGLLGVSPAAEPPARAPPASPVADACLASSPPTLDLEVPFGFADTALTETGHVRLSELGAWLWCHPGARVTLAVATEPHYRRPEIERDLAAGRRQSVTAYLEHRGVGADRLDDGDVQNPAAPGSARLVLKGRGW